MSAANFSISSTVPNRDDYDILFLTPVEIKRLLGNCVER
jgi:hypothetical protein